MLQETQFASLEGMDLGRFWGKGCFEFDWVGATGRSGGLLSIWDPKRFSVSRIEKHHFYLCIHGILKDNGKVFSVVNVYAPQKLRDKRALWAELESIISRNHSFWVVGGDFNCVRDRSGRRNSKFNAQVSNEFIVKVDLQEFVLRGRKFTFVPGNKCSRIGRIFVSWNFLNEWTNADYRALAREESDHCPLVLKIEARNFGPKPFRFFNSWLSRADLHEVVNKALSGFDEIRPPDVLLLHKFKRIKVQIIEWHKKWSAEDHAEELNLKAELFDLDEYIDERDLTEAEMWVYVEAKKRLRELEEIKKKDIRQRSCVRWARDGDENSSFFSRFSQYEEDIPTRPKLECFGIKRLTEEDAEELVVQFSEKEIKEAVFDCGGDKAPGPDGFNFRFVQMFWSLLADDFV
ncbi:uncharacterized protein LOC143584777 [Bidens hawaiensis]|uniref:uncharacterized protein LOC143584777 n=1 Tax=Bidens hawaiensis TaxID=980011 RepID=UPI00404A8FC3